MGGSGLHEIDAPYRNNRELREARSELADAVRQLLPRGSRVFTPTIERTDAGRAQAKAVSPRDSSVAMDVELDIRSPTSSRFPGGIQFKPDGIRFLPKKRYLFLEHKEVMTIWRRSNYGREDVPYELEQKVRRNADIYLDLCPYGCAGFQYTCDKNDLADIIADMISRIGGAGRQGLLAPILQPTYRKSRD